MTSVGREILGTYPPHFPLKQCRHIRRFFPERIPHKSRAYVRVIIVVLRQFPCLHVHAMVHLVAAFQAAQSLARHLVRSLTPIK